MTMQKQNEMMDFVWLLNAADNSAYETKGLYTEFLRRQNEFLENRRNVLGNESQNKYLEQELSRNLESYKELQIKINEVIKVLKAAINLGLDKGSGIPGTEHE
jgi:response regulator RpfG family c-di-GMP phosphodiesterase